MVQPVVGQAALAQVEDANGTLQLAGQRRDERRLAATGWTVQEVAAPVWDSPFSVPDLKTVTINEEKLQLNGQ